MNDKLKLKDFYKVAKFIQGLAVKDDGNVKFAPFSNEKHFSETMATVTVPMEEYYKLMNMDKEKSLEILDETVGKLSTARITISKKYNSDHLFEIDGTCLGGVTTITQSDGTVIKRIDYMKGWEAHIYDPLEEIILSKIEEE